MPTSYIEFLVEEESTKAFLDACLPNILPKECSFQIHPFQGKYALLRKLEQRLKGYSKWLQADYRIVVIVDRDNDDCRMLKSTLEQSCANVKLQSRRATGDPHWQVVTRIAIEELEAWYFGDWQAVCDAFPRVSKNIPTKPRYRDPDAIKGGTWEAFERILQQHGYFKQGLAKKQAATSIGRYINPDRNTSHSFNLFRDAIVEAIK